MKVQIVQTVEVSDEQREALARLLDGPDARKRLAKRDEFKDYVWRFGAGWATALALGGTDSDNLVPEDLLGDVTPQAPAEPDTDADDLLGEPQDAPSLDDLL